MTTIPTLPTPARTPTVADLPSGASDTARRRLADNAERFAAHFDRAVGAADRSPGRRDDDAAHRPSDARVAHGDRSPMADRPVTTGVRGNADRRARVVGNDDRAVADGDPDGFARDPLEHVTEQAADQSPSVERSDDGPDPATTESVTGAAAHAAVLAPVATIVPIPAAPAEVSADPSMGSVIDLIVDAPAAGGATDGTEPAAAGATLPASGHTAVVPPVVTGVAAASGAALGPAADAAGAADAATGVPATGETATGETAPAESGTVAAGTVATGSGGASRADSGSSGASEDTPTGGRDTGPRTNAAAPSALTTIDPAAMPTSTQAAPAAIVAATRATPARAGRDAIDVGGASAADVVGSTPAAEAAVAAVAGAEGDAAAPSGTERSTVATANVGVHSQRDATSTSFDMVAGALDGADGSAANTADAADITAARTAADAAALRGPGLDHISVDLSDEGLGPLTLQAANGIGGLHVRLTAGDRMVGDALATAADQLRRDLEASGTALGSFDVGHRSDDPGTRQHFAPSDRAGSSPTRAADRSAERAADAARRAASSVAALRSTTTGAAGLDLLI